MTNSEVKLSIVKLWEIDGRTTHETGCFNNYWKNCLGVTEFQGYVYLIWGKIPDFPAAGYKIYCAISNVANPIVCV